MSTLRTETIERIVENLRAGPRTTKQLAFELGTDQIGIASCLNGMKRRGEVTRTIVKPGKPAVWRLTSN